VIAMQNFRIIFMNKSFLRRRQMLMYLGVGAAAAATPSLYSKFVDKSESSNLLSDKSLDDSAIAAQSPGGIPLPEFQGISQWLNSPPLMRNSLKGSVALIQIWTFACINCQRTLPYVTDWHRKYEAKGLKVVGVHTPEFAFERDPNNIKNALKKHGITYPIAVDNDFKTWNAYNNKYWPHLFVADRQGIIRYDHVGEGAYDTTEQTIRRLLG
jgi:thiol-disulfide isomerase/thioredoxin